MKGYGSKINDKLPPKKRRKIDIPPKKDPPPKTTRKLDYPKNMPYRGKSPSSSGPLKPRDRRSESPRSLKPARDADRDRYNPKKRDTDDTHRGRPPLDKGSSKPRLSDESKSRGDDRSSNNPRSKDGGRRSRTPLDRPKHLNSAKDSLLKANRRSSRTPDKSSRTWHSSQDGKSSLPNSSSSIRDRGRGDRDPYGSKRPGSRDRSKIGNRKPDSGRQRSRERRSDRDHGSRDDRSHSRLGGRDPRDKDRDTLSRPNHNLSSSSLDKGRLRERGLPEPKGRPRDKDRKTPPPRSSFHERDKSASDRERNSDRFLGVDDRHRGARFEGSSRGAYGSRGAGDRGKEPGGNPMKFDRLADRGGNRDSPRQRNPIIEDGRNFERGLGGPAYGRLPPPPPPPPEHWEQHEEHPMGHSDYRDHRVLEEDRRKPLEPRRFNNNSPFPDRRLSRDERNQPRYPLPPDRPFEELHHPMYVGEPMRPVAIR